MASAIVTSWGANFAGREQMGLGVFMAAVQWFNELKQKKEISDLRLFLSEQGDLSKFAGQMIIEGTEAQLDALMARDEYRKLIMKAAHVVHGFKTVRCVTGETVMQRIEMVQAVRKELGI